MKKLLTGIAFFLSTGLLLAQNSNLSAATTVGKINSNSIRVYDEEKAYLLKDWPLGKVVFRSGQTEYLPINYNGYNQQLEWLSDGKALTINQSVKEFVLNDTSAAKGYLFKNGFEPIDGQGVLSFYQVLYEGKKTRLVKYVKFKTREKRNFNEANTTVNFDMYQTYYFADRGGKMKRIKNSKKDISEYFNNDNVNTFIEGKKLKFKEWDDVIEVLNYTESL